MKLLSRIEHRGQSRIAARMPYDIKIIERFKQVKGRRWSSTLKVWHFPDNNKTIEQLKELFPEYMSDNNTEELNKKTIYKKEKKEVDVQIEEYIYQYILKIKTHFKNKDIIKEVGGVYFNPEEKVWILEASNNSIETLLFILQKEKLEYSYKKVYTKPIDTKKTALKNLPALSKEKELAIKEFKRWLSQKRRAKNTIDTYVHCMTVFLRYYADREIESISIKEIEDFNNDFILKHGYSGTTQSQYISAIKVFYVVMLGINHEIDSMERPAKGRRLPKVIAKQDVERLLKNIRNRKHRMVLSTIYGLGLRRSELINLQLKDIDFNRNAILIFNSKGKKDRIVPFPAKLKKQMLEYISEYEPEKYLVEGREKGEKYSDTTIGKIFKKYADNVLKSNTFTPHSLRHSLATHLLDSGVDIRYIQELLGHKSSRTTEIYTHVSMRSLKEIRNPLDDFDI